MMGWISGISTVERLGSIDGVSGNAREEPMEDIAVDFKAGKDRGLAVFSCDE